MQDKHERVKQTERNLARAKAKNTGVKPAGKSDKTRDKMKPDNPGQTIVNSDQNSG